VVLATRDRARLLGRALESLLALEHVRDELELVVVDNGSTDATRQVIDEVAARAPLPVRGVFEPRRGLSSARNRGLREARGRWVLFTDDDQLVCPRIVREHLRVASAHGVRVVQGAIELAFPDGRPEWLRGGFDAMLGRTRPRAEGLTDDELYGGNLFLARELFQSAAPFREDLGKGRSGWAEDVELGRRLRAHGERVAFAPEAKVVHVIERDRVTAGHIRRSAFDKGVSDGLMAPGRFGGTSVAARAALAAATQASASLVGRALRDPHRALLGEALALNRLGRAVGALRGART
jgi:GT2 family glycosyltransferase